MGKKKIKWYFPLISVGSYGKTLTINEFYRLCIEKYNYKGKKYKKNSDARRFAELLVNGRIVKAFLIPSSYQEQQKTFTEREKMWEGIKDSIENDIEKALDNECDIIIAAFSPKNNFILDTVDFVGNRSIKTTPVYLRGEGHGSTLDHVFEKIRKLFDDSRIINRGKYTEIDQAEKLESIIQRYCKHDIA